MRHRILGWVLVGPLLAACGDGEDTVRVTAYGESFIEDGIPASEMDDGWP